jgi:hypothetical protein
MMLPISHPEQSDSSVIVQAAAAAHVLALNSPHLQTVEQWHA